MEHEFPESDWKTFRELRQVALERFCKRVLDEVARFPPDTEPDEFARFTPQTRERIQLLAKEAR